MRSNFKVKLQEADALYMSAHPLPEVHITEALKNVCLEVERKYESESGKRDGWENPNLPWRALLERAVRMPWTLQEAQSSAAFGQLLRVGVQMIANAWYKRTVTTFQELCYVQQSKNRMEFDAPLFGAARPNEVKAGQPFREQGVLGQDIEIVNKKFGAIVSFQKELFTDDQTGQIQGFAGQLGSSMMMWKDQYFSRRFLGAASSDFAPTQIEASHWTGFDAQNRAVSTPFSSTLFQSKADGTQAVGNRPTTFVQFNHSALLRARQMLRRAKDPQGQAITVVPTHLWGSTFDEEHFEEAVTSPYFASIPGKAETADTAASASSGFFGGLFTKNVIQGKLKPVVNVHFAEGVWGIAEGGKGFKDQEREPMTVVQEVPNSGDSFVLGVYRFKSEARWEMDYVDPRFTYMGCDASLAGTLTQ